MTNHACVRICMHGNAACSEMVLTGLLTIVLCLTQLALLLERYIQQTKCDLS